MQHIADSRGSFCMWSGSWLSVYLWCVLILSCCTASSTVISAVRSGWWMLPLLTVVLQVPVAVSVCGLDPVYQCISGVLILSCCTASSTVTSAVRSGWWMLPLLTVVLQVPVAVSVCGLDPGYQCISGVFLFRHVVRPQVRLPAQYGVACIMVHGILPERIDHTAPQGHHHCGDLHLHLQTTCHHKRTGGSGQTQ